jgi:hypothetical protein
VESRIILLNRGYFLEIANLTGKRRKRNFVKDAILNQELSK